jgi:hypothetical protein
MNKCTATNDAFYVCELERGHTCRHRDGTYTWLDQSVIDARAQARQNRDKSDGGEALAKLLTFLESVSTTVNWKQMNIKNRCRSMGFWRDIE